MATKRSLATKLGVVAGFERPDAALEQYPTPPELAAHIVHLADLHGDVEGRTVLDLGAGTGMLALAAALRGPDRVVGLELDGGALATARGNERRVAASAPVHWVRGDATRPPLAV
ncbi:RNA methyltransferase, partial [Halorubrum ezzemoulense]